MPRSSPAPRFVFVTFLFAALTTGGCSEPAAVEQGVARVPDRGAESTRPAPQTESEEGPVVAFLGDSISAGLHSDLEDAFPAVLQRRLAAEGAPFRLVNAGVSGDTTAGGLRRLDWVLKSSPELVVVELGGNDGLRGTPLEAVEENLRAIVAGVRAAGARVLLLGMQLPANYGPEYIEGFRALYTRTAEELDVPYLATFLDGVGGVAELNHPDGIHPNEEGHQRLADNVAPMLRELVLELEAAR